MSYKVSTICILMIFQALFVTVCPLTGVNSCECSQVSEISRHLHTRFYVRIKFTYQKRTATCKQGYLNVDSGVIQRKVSLLP
jgi:hypothetical protein